MLFLSTFRNTARDNVRASLEFKDMSAEQMQVVCDTFMARCNELPFSQAMSFLYLCLGMCVLHPMHDGVARANMKRLLAAAKQHDEASRGALIRFENACISRHVLPSKTSEEIMEDDMEPLLHRISAAIQEARNKGHDFVLRDKETMLEISVRQINKK